MLSARVSIYIVAGFKRSMWRCARMLLGWHSAGAQWCMAAETGCHHGYACYGRGRCMYYVNGWQLVVLSSSIAGVVAV
jgi:hypothetical protein